MVLLTMIPRKLRGTIVNRTYGLHKNLYVHMFLLTICVYRRSYLLWSLGILRGTIVNKTYGLHKNYSQYMVLFTMVPRNSVRGSSAGCRYV